MSYLSESLTTSLHFSIMASERSKLYNVLKPRKLSSLLKKRYRYKSVDKSAREIRLLTLLPGAFSSKIQIRLYHASLDPDDRPIYEALSYTWGSTVDPVDIEVLSRWNKFLLITKNLAEALPYLRYTDRSRPVDRLDMYRSNECRRAWPPSWLHGRYFQAVWSGCHLARGRTR